jgi:hypothetical protein
MFIYYILPNLAAAFAVDAPHSRLSPPPNPHKNMNNTSHPTYPSQAGNAIKHGMTASEQLFLTRLHPLEGEILLQLRQNLYVHYQPEGSVEELIVDRIAIQQFRLFRFYRLEYETINANMNGDPTGETTVPKLDPFSRYDSRVSHHLLQLERALRMTQQARRNSHGTSQDKTPN